MTSFGFCADIKRNEDVDAGWYVSVYVCGLKTFTYFIYYFMIREKSGDIHKCTKVDYIFSPFCMSLYITLFSFVDGKMGKSQTAIFHVGFRY